MVIQSRYAQQTKSSLHRTPLPSARTGGAETLSCS